MNSTASLFETEIDNISEIISDSSLPLKIFFEGERLISIIESDVIDGILKLTIAKDMISVSPFVIIDPKWRLFKNLKGISVTEAVSWEIDENEEITVISEKEVKLENDIIVKINTDINEIILSIL